MNQKFYKALYLLDLGKYQEGEGLIRQAIEETQNLYEKCRWQPVIRSCYIN